MKSQTTIYLGKPQGIDVLFDELYLPHGFSPITFGKALTK